MRKLKYENVNGTDIGIYHVISECDYKSKNGKRMFYVKCNVCGWEGNKSIGDIASSKKCTHDYAPPKIDETFGIYKNVRKSGNKSGATSLYYAECSKCGRTVERRLYDIKHFNNICSHGAKTEKLDIDGPNRDYSKEDQLYYRRVYDMWRHMIYRATPEYWDKFPSYEGTSISDEWKSFDVFWDDIKELPNYEEWKNSYGKRMMLDKDILGHGRKIYSKETCCFLTHGDSNRDVAIRHPENIKKAIEASQEYKDNLKRKVKATNKKTRETIIFNSINECANSLGLKKSNIWMCLSKDDDYASHQSSGGWIFEDVD